METTLLGLLLIVVFVGIPGAALAIRLVLRPLLRELATAVLAVKGNNGTELVERLEAVEDAQLKLERTLGNALEIGAFDRELAALGAEAETAADRAHPTSPAR